MGKSSFSRCRHSLTRHGGYLPTTGLGNTFLSLWTSVTRGRRVITGMSVEKNDELAFVKRLIEAGELQIVIDRTYALDDLVEAHRYVETGRKRGNVVVTVTPDGSD